jgi:hypothetical protein
LRLVEDRAVDEISGNRGRLFAAVVLVFRQRKK